jgi:cytochrome c2
MRKTLRLTLLALGLLGWAFSSQATEAKAPQLPKGWKFGMPKGDPVAGKEAFRKMQCYGCHKVPGAGLPEERTSGGVGPDLVPAYSKLPAEFLAESIMDSHKYISGEIEHYRGLDKKSSKMGDYTTIMTVRELLDIVAFLKHLPSPDKGAATTSTAP